MKATLFAASAALAALGTSALVLAAAAPASQAVQVDDKLPRYTVVEGVSGTIKSAGSDTMIELMTHWQEGFQRLYPEVKITIEGKGSSSAPPALTDGTVTFGTMSREMKAEEVDAFEKKFGYKPTPLSTGIDTLAVFVNKDNPIQALTFPQIDAVFSKTRKGGYEKDVRTWGELGLTGDWAQKPISLYGRNSASGTYGYFKEHALFKGDFKDTVKEQPGSSAVIQGVATDKYALGYSGIGFKTADVRAVPLSADAGSPPVGATPENAYSGEYPLSRFLYVYVNRAPGKDLDPLPREFLRYVFSQQGQSDVVKAGFLPVTADIAQAMLSAVGVASAPVNAGYGKK